MVLDIEDDAVDAEEFTRLLESASEVVERIGCTRDPEAEKILRELYAKKKDKLYEHPIAKECRT